MSTPPGGHDPYPLPGDPAGNPAGDPYGHRQPQPWQVADGGEGARLPHQGHRATPAEPGAGTGRRRKPSPAQPSAPSASATHTVPSPAGPADGPSRPAAPAGPGVRTGSPIIEPGLRPAALTAVLAALLAVSAQAGRPALAVAVVLLQALTAAGWYRLNGMWPARQGIALAFAAGLTADVALLAAGRQNAAVAIVGSLGVWVVLLFVLHLRNRSTPDERLYALTAGTGSTVLTVLAAGLLAAEGVDPGVVTAGAAAVAAAVVARALPLPAVVSVPVALLAAAGAGIAAGSWGELGTGGAVLGAGAGVCALVGLRVASYDWPSRFVHMTAGVALPLSLAAPAVYLLGRVVA
ncbi:hypothetical protein QNO07_02880 [Streptomyces sp. 549]|uniref:hypothetical protein n=1 Tax=Streptomyces sp. 549 TaxID=3049076 RepID=UPI0024C41385|nr:hypothetical protein [Streptomyces sp. 549]MDK1472379.1 hypothetical protein [Streptomyces sp. 549]